MLQPKKKTNDIDFFRDVKPGDYKVKRQAELALKERQDALSDRKEFESTGMIKNPRSVSYSSKVRQQPEVSQDNRTDYERKFDEKKGRKKELEKKIINAVATSASVAELGNFIPHPAAQTIGKLGSATNVAINTYQLAKDIQEKDMNSALIDGSSLALSSLTGSSVFKRNSKYSNLAKKLGGGRTSYINVGHRVRNQSKIGLLSNRTALTASLGEAGVNLSNLLNDFKK